MRRKQFIQLLAKLRDELSISSDPAIGSAATPNLKQVLSRVYETLYDAHDWTHLRQIFPRLTLNAGERYYDFPENMDFDNLEEVKVWWGGQPHTITRGIDFEHYAAVSSDDDQRSDPVERWDVRLVGNKEMIEVWPIPSGTGQALQFKGKTKFAPLINDADLCLLDDQLVVLYAAAELAPPKKRTEISAKLNAAQARLGIVKMRGKAASPSFRMGLSQDRPRLFGGVTIRVGR
ncbi:MAG: phage adaptor protein [Rhizomicrobium sp.]